jgi:hypothetical protein
MPVTVANKRPIIDRQYRQLPPDDIRPPPVIFTAEHPTRSRDVSLRMERGQRPEAAFPPGGQVRCGSRSTPHFIPMLQYEVTGNRRYWRVFVVPNTPASAWV